MLVLRWLWLKWVPIAHAVGNFQARVILTLIYMVMVAPFAVGARLLSDPLMLHSKRAGVWYPREVQGYTMIEAERQS
ncbi:MAG: hypothetical protein HW403_694 [Dehalococcoidia bacterium]|nr:hypothetical protein [Dehalococcoidia bacterium]